VREREKKEKEREREERKRERVLRLCFNNVLNAVPGVSKPKRGDIISPYALPREHVL
jgi:hypothetical protein